jgi:antitoxin component of RelBE/YafQ-DinJ toxin-antitoxin module
MSMVELGSRIDQDEERTFKETTRKLGTTPADAVKIFVSAFNQYGGFPFDVRIRSEPEPFATEAEAQDFIDSHALRMFE